MTSVKKNYKIPDNIRKEVNGKEVFAEEVNNYKIRPKKFNNMNSLIYLFRDVFDGDPKLMLSSDASDGDLIVGNKLICMIYRGLFFSILPKYCRLRLAF